MSQIHVDILEQVKQYWCSPYICDNVWYCRGKYEKEAEQIKKWIQDSLKGCFSYSEWMRLNHLDFVNLNIIHKFDESSYETGRLQWIDWMIENHTIFDNVEVD